MPVRRPGYGAPGDIYNRRQAAPLFESALCTTFGDHVGPIRILLIRFVFVYCYFLTDIAFGTGSAECYCAH